jgi:hypothetical protein
VPLHPEYCQQFVVRSDGGTGGMRYGSLPPRGSGLAVPLSLPPKVILIFNTRTMEATMLPEAEVLEAAVVSDSLIQDMIVSGSMEIARDESHHHDNVAEAEHERVGQSMNHLATTLAVVLEASVVCEIHDLLRRGDDDEAAVVSDSLIQDMIVSGSVEIARDESHHHDNAAEAEDKRVGQSIRNHLATTLVVGLETLVLGKKTFVAEATTFFGEAQTFFFWASEAGRESSSREPDFARRVEGQCGSTTVCLQAGPFAYLPRPPPRPPLPAKARPRRPGLVALG